MGTTSSVLYLSSHLRLPLRMLAPSRLRSPPTSFSLLARSLESGQRALGTRLRVHVFDRLAQDSVVGRSALAARSRTGRRAGRRAPITAAAPASEVNGRASDQARARWRFWVRNFLTDTLLISWVQTSMPELTSAARPLFARRLDRSVGKTALRQRYFGQAFQEGYRATIGCDYIVKALELDPPSASDPAPANPADVGRPQPSLPSVSVRLAVWDTAGQERYASLSTAFFRGADAVVFVYDARSRRSLHALGRWWATFGERCPVRDGDERAFPVAVVGNKADLVHPTNGSSHTEEDGPVSEAEARAYWESLLPPAVSETRPPPAPLGSTIDGLRTGPTSDPPLSPTEAPSSPLTASISVSSAPPPVKPPAGANGSILSGAHHANEATYQAPTESFSSAVRSALADRPPIGPPPAPPLTSSGLAAPLPSTVARGGFHLPPAPSSASLASYKTARSSLTVVGSSSSGGPSSSLPRAPTPIDEHASGLPDRASSSGWSSHDELEAEDTDGGGSHRPAHQRSMSTASTSRLSVASVLSGETGSSEITVRPPPARDRPRDKERTRLIDASSSGDQSIATVPPVSPADGHAADSFGRAPGGPAFFPSVSAKTGDSVPDIFEHLARAVYQLREREAAAAEEGEALVAATRASAGKVTVGQDRGKGVMRRACGC